MDTGFALFFLLSVFLRLFFHLFLSACHNHLQDAFGDHAFVSALLSGELVYQAHRKVRDSLGREDKKNRGICGFRRMCNILVAGRLRSTLSYGPDNGSSGLLQNQNNISLATSHDGLLITHRSRGQSQLAQSSRLAPQPYVVNRHVSLAASNRF